MSHVNIQYKFSHKSFCFKIYARTDANASSQEESHIIWKVANKAQNSK